MKSDKNQLTTLITPIKPILQAIIDAGGTPYAVGGSVRDHVLQRPLKDLDIEVHGLEIERLEGVLRTFGSVELIGKQFGVLKLLSHEFGSVDWSLPRSDSLGRKPTVTINPHLGIAEACRRRDITMNAMAVDLGQLLNSGSVTIIDPYGGLDDIAMGQIRAVDEKLFLEDPLRFFRVMQFIGRFQMQPDTDLDNLCAHMTLQDPATGAPLALERITEEIKKLLLLSHNPSRGLRWIAAIGRLRELYPELADLQETPQRPDYHPEGNVFEHSMQALDASARLRDQGLFKDPAESYLLMLSSLCHDLGKASTTTPDLHAHGHEMAGVQPTQQLLKRMTNDQGVIKAACKIVRHHLAPRILVKDNSSAKAYKRLAARLAPDVTLRQLGLVALCDWQGRNGDSHEPLSLYHDRYAAFLQCATDAAVLHGPEAPILLGRHLLDVVQPGPALGKMLEHAYEIQIEEGVTDPEALKRRVL